MATIALAVRAYQQSFDSRPYTTLAITNGTLTALGDVVAQATQIFMAKPGHHDTRPKYDPLRTLQFFTFGFGMGPLIGRWNKFLEARFPLRLRSASFSPLSAGVRIGPEPLVPVGEIGIPIGVAAHQIRPLAVLQRVACDQLIMAPVGLALFIGSMGIMEGRDLPHLAQKYEGMYSAALVANWQVWPLAQVINFRYMPLPYRVPFQSTCGIFWNLYLSLLNASGNERGSKEETMRDTVDTASSSSEHSQSTDELSSD